MNLIYTTKFKKDYKLAKKQGKSFDVLQEALSILIEKKELPEKFNNHPLIGNYTGFFECHLQPDWLLIYKLDEEAIYLTRLGSHSELFKK